MAGWKVCKMYSDVDNLALTTHYPLHTYMVLEQPSGNLRDDLLCKYVKKFKIQDHLHRTEKIK